jgi:hypothetical protein
MAIPKKIQPVESPWKRYILREGGWKRVIKVSIGLGIIAILASKFLSTYKDIKRQKLYSDGERLLLAGQKGSEMDLYYNENRKREESLKPIVDTSEKVPFGQTNLK